MPQYVSWRDLYWQTPIVKREIENLAKTLVNANVVLFIALVAALFEPKAEEQNATVVWSKPTGV